MVRITLRELSSKVGAEIGASEWFEVSQQIIDDFARATRDLQWIHVDADRAARESPFRLQNGRGGTVAHGLLTLSLLSHLLQSALVVSDRTAGINVGYDRVRFVSPVLAGSRIRARFTLASSDPIKGGAKLQWSVIVECEGQVKPVLVAEWVMQVLTAGAPHELPEANS